MIFFFMDKKNAGMVLISGDHLYYDIFYLQGLYVDFYIFFL